MKVVMIPGIEAALKALVAAQGNGEGSESGSGGRIRLWFHGTEEAICGHAVRAFALCAVRARPEADGWNAFALELRGPGADDAIAYRAHGGWPVGVRPCGCAWRVVGV